MVRAVELRSLRLSRSKKKAEKQKTFRRGTHAFASVPASRGSSTGNRPAPEGRGAVAPYRGEEERKDNLPHVERAAPLEVNVKPCLWVLDGIASLGQAETRP